jgi:hypothetical protein
MKRLLALAAIVAASVVGCVPAYSSEVDAIDRPLEVIAESLVLECSQHGYIQATDETGQWVLRYYLVTKNKHGLTADFTPEEVQEYDRLRNGYNKLKEVYFPEMCESMIKNIQGSEEAKHFKFVEK